MDPLSEIIRQARPRSITVGATDVGGDIAIRFPAHDGAYLYSVAAGECLLQVEGDPTWTRLGAGDCVVLASGRAFLLASATNLAPIDADIVFAGRDNGSIATYNGGGRCMMFAAQFEFESEFSRILFADLDAIVRIGDPGAKAALRSAIEQMIDELQRGQPGCEIVVDHLAHIALVKVLRFHLAEVAHARPGWIYALADRQIARAIAEMHHAPSKPWTVAALASISAMSRTSFAIRFKATVGTAPMDYLTQLRMVMAATRLREPGARIAVVARELGYESESAFSAAFKRTTGVPPGRYAHNTRRATLSTM